MDLAEFVEKTKNLSYLFHFTDTRNIPSIKQHGLLSLRELKRRNIGVTAFGGNEWSHEEDERRGLDLYVHLCMRKSHPMEYKAKQDGRLINTSFLRISPQALLAEGVLFTDQVANKAGSVAFGWAEATGKLDWQVLVNRTDWKDPNIQARLRVAEKYEVLVPAQIATEYIGGI
ncbi:DUF4433 domain-containing protein [Rhizobium leguminosarum]|uniref:DarT ssDNA thymidine ADP-ribosyltransferase family protein n=1 Tax=Rhizobium leguminosarum TaxID=384 RepID=UPI001C94917E|nr:DarT ssDNA thymidine ADP-ribosyltransferase family protein [Rhizobium leguminosarum]MBY5777348.1 DUF4433 domain-containing protein [Rhizobium leguminosarum]